MKAITLKILKENSWKETENHIFENVKTFSLLFPKSYIELRGGG